MLERRLFRRKSTGEVIDPDWLQFSFPTWYFYDVLRGLDYLRDAEVEPDERVAEAIEVVEGNRDPDGRWPLQNVHEGEAHFEMDDGEGKPSRWNTLRAMRVLAGGTRAADRCPQEPVGRVPSKAGAGAAHLPPGPVDPAALTIVPANEASREDLGTIFGVRGYPAYCQCQRFKIGPSGWTEPTTAERWRASSEQTHCGYPSATRTSGLVAYLIGEPVGWCAVEPRTTYTRLPPPPGRVEAARRGPGRRERLGGDLLRDPGGLPAPGHHPRARRGHRRVRARARRPGARGLPDDHRARRGGHLGRDSTSAPAASSRTPGSPRSTTRPSAGS